jgi:hypothetical protein
MTARIAAGTLRGSRAAIRLLATLVALLGAAPAAAAPSADWRDYTALARTDLTIGPNIELIGNFGVIEPGGEMSVGLRTTLRGPDPFADQSFVASDRLTLGTLSSVNDVRGSMPALIVGLDTFGGTIGFLVSGSGHELRGVRATGASQYGLLVMGSNHEVSMNRVEDNGVAGLLLSGSGNVAAGGTLSANPVGVLVNGTGNTVDGITTEGNAGDGLRAEGSGHLLRNLRTNRNGGNGFALPGSSIALRSSHGRGQRRRRRPRERDEQPRAGQQAR